jgi:vacuolar-type H+-ATPase subunit F/Vma7
MIVIGNAELVLGMKFCGITNSHIVKEREEVIEILKTLDKNEVILANNMVVELAPEIKEFRNLATIPDSLDGFDNVDDLKYIVKNAIGVELEGL